MASINTPSSSCCHGRGDGDGDNPPIFHGCNTTATEKLSLQETKNALGCQVGRVYDRPDEDSAPPITLLVCHHHRQVGGFYDSSTLGCQISGVYDRSAKGSALQETANVPEVQISGVCDSSTEISALKASPNAPVHQVVGRVYNSSTIEPTLQGTMDTLSCQVGKGYHWSTKVSTPQGTPNAADCQVGRVYDSLNKELAWPQGTLDAPNQQVGRSYHWSNEELGMQGASNVPNCQFEIGGSHQFGSPHRQVGQSQGEEDFHGCPLDEPHCPATSLEDLDVHILAKVFVTLSPRDLATCSLVSKLWLRATADLWQRLCLERWPSLAASSNIVKSFSSFFSQRSSNVTDPSAVSWLATYPITFFLDISLRGHPFFSQTIAGSAVMKDRLRFKLPPIPTRTPSEELQRGENEGIIGGPCSHWDPYTELHVQLSIVRHSDGESACLVNGFPCHSNSNMSLPGGNHGCGACGNGYGLQSVLIIIDNHTFLNVLW